MNYVALRDSKRSWNKLAKSFKLDQIAGALRFQSFCNDQAGV